MKIGKIMIWIVFMLVFSATARYNKQRGFDYAVASGLAYCDPKRILEGDCHDATKMAKQAGMKVLHAYGNDREIDQIQYAILAQEQRKELVIAFSGTENPIQLIEEITESYPVEYSIHPSRGSLVFDFFLKNYVS